MVEAVFTKLVVVPAKSKAPDFSEALHSFLLTSTRRIWRLLPQQLPLSILASRQRR